MTFYDILRLFIDLLAPKHIMNGIYWKVIDFAFFWQQLVPIVQFYHIKSSYNRTSFNCLKQLSNLGHNSSAETNMIDSIVCSSLIASHLEQLSLSFCNAIIHEKGLQIDIESRPKSSDMFHSIENTE